MSVRFRSTDPVDFSLDPFAGSTHTNGKPILPVVSDDEEDVLDHLVYGTQIDTGDENVITFAFTQLTHAVGEVNNPHYGEGYGYSPMTEEQREASRAAVALWDDLVSATFVEVTPTSGASDWAQNTADIWLANTTTGPGQAWAYYPAAVSTANARLGSDVWIADPRINPSNLEFEFGEYGNTTIIHELGHSLGLTHPGAYNGTGEFEDDAEYAQDTYQYSIMSYFNGENSGQLAVNWNLGGLYANYPQGPQLHDIVAIQSIYGADLTTRVGATTYGFNSNAGNAVYDFNANPYPMFSIYDAGGIDTIDASGFTVSQFINLQDGGFSSIGGSAPSAAEVNAYWTEYYAGWGLDFSEEIPFTDAEVSGNQDAAQDAVAFWIEAETGVAGIRATQFDNVSIAYDTVIENAVGGSARDLLWGNDSANQLNGMGGNDVLQGFGGNDRLIGGAGADTFVFANDGSIDTIVDFRSGTDTIDLSEIEGATRRYVSYDKNAGQVKIDTDHDGTADMFINVENRVASNDFIYA